MADLGPARLALLALHLQPGAKGLQTPLQHPFRLALLARDEADGVLAQALGQDVGFDVGDEAVFVFAAEIADCFDGFDIGRHGATCPLDSSCWTRPRWQCAAAGERRNRRAAPARRA